MSNTLIQIKRSTSTARPVSLNIAEPAYSYISNTAFIGTPDGLGIVPIGGYFYTTRANAALNASAAAFDKANSANLLAYDTGIGANAFASDTIAGANAAVGAGANNYANSTFVKLIDPNQTITGNLSITGSLTVSGNAFSIDTETLRVSDPLIYLASNNYFSDIVDIGFVANYNDGASNLHTGLFRDATIKQYYLFEGYDKEPVPNHIDTAANNFTLSTLNANFITSNLILGGINAISWIASAYDKANSANLLAYNTGIGANAFASATIAGANTAVGTGANSYASAVGIAANSYAALIGSVANTNAANASYLSTGTVSSDRVSGSYTGITGIGTLTVGTWNADTIKVPYGGTGMTSFTQNGILFGNTAGDLKVTAAGTEGQVLQASSTGVPQFGMLDGGTF